MKKLLSIGIILTLAPIEGITIPPTTKYNSTGYQFNIDINRDSDTADGSNTPDNDGDNNDSGSGTDDGNTDTGGEPGGDNIGSVGGSGDSNTDSGGGSGDSNTDSSAGSGGSNDSGAGSDGNNTGAGSSGNNTGSGSGSGDSNTGLGSGGSNTGSGSGSAGSNTGSGSGSGGSNTGSGSGSAGSNTGSAAGWGSSNISSGADSGVNNINPGARSSGSNNLFDNGTIDRNYNIDVLLADTHAMITDEDINSDEETMPLEEQDENTKLLNQLKKLIHFLESKELDSMNYTEDSWMMLVEGLEQANELVINEEVSEEDLKSIIQTLQTAYSDLELIQTEEITEDLIIPTQKPTIMFVVFTIIGTLIFAVLVYLDKKPRKNHKRWLT